MSKVNLVIEPESILTYKRLTYYPWTALAELIDNSTTSYALNKGALDAAYRAEGADERVEVRVTIGETEGEKWVRVTDTALGMDLPTLINSLKIGRPPVDTTHRSKYGMGMKTASCWFGDRWTITTSRLGEKGGHRVTVDVNAIAAGNNDLNYEFLKNHGDNEHFTIIEISSLHQTSLAGRTLGRIRTYLQGIYRKDLGTETQPGEIRLYVNDVAISGDVFKDTDFLQDASGNLYKKPFNKEWTRPGGKRQVAQGWIGILESGSRSKAGFSLFESGRMLKGHPEAWRPQGIFGQVLGTNDLINQRLVGEVELFGFIPTHTKDDVSWQGDEQDEVESYLEEVAKDYRQVAQARRKHSDDERGPSAKERAMAVSELRTEFGTPEFREVFNDRVPLPPRELIEADLATLKANLADRGDWEIEVPLESVDGEPMLARVGIDEDLRPTDPYIVWQQSASGKQVDVVINWNHPALEMISGADDLVVYMRLAAYEALSEWQAVRLGERVRPDEIRLIKGRLLAIAYATEFLARNDDRNAS